MTQSDAENEFAVLLHKNKNTVLKHKRLLTHIFRWLICAQQIWKTIYFKYNVIRRNTELRSNPIDKLYLTNLQESKNML